MAAPLILVVDDEESNLKVLERLLGREGYEVRTARTGPDALDLARANTPELLLTDLKMPGMDGLELLKAVRTVSPTTEVIMMTAYGTVEIAVEAMKVGAYDFVTKPLKSGKAEIDAAPTIQKVVVTGMLL